MQTQTDILVDKIRQLPSSKIAEVEDFVDFLAEREELKLVRAATKLSEDAFANVWENDEDAVYDEL